MTPKTKPPRLATGAARNVDLAGTLINEENSRDCAAGQGSRGAAEMPAVTIYDGQVWLGSINETAPGRFEAAPASGPSLGVFPSRQAAAQAILMARGPQDGRRRGL